MGLLYESSPKREKKVAQQKEEEQAQFIELRAQGQTLRECCKVLNKPLSTLGEWNKALATEIRHARREWLIQQCGIPMESQLKLYADIVKRLQQALSQKNMDELSTHDLLNMITKFTFAQHDRLSHNHF